MNKNIFVEKKIVETIFEKKNLYLRYGKYILLLMVKVFHSAARF